MAKMAALVNMSGQQQSQVSVPKLNGAGDVDLNNSAFLAGCEGADQAETKKNKKKKKKKKNRKCAAGVDPDSHQK